MCCIGSDDVRADARAGVVEWNLKSALKSAFDDIAWHRLSHSGTAFRRLRRNDKKLGDQW
jgi:hypothetical protein